MTALLEAVGRVLALAGTDAPDKAVIGVITGGRLNASREVSREGVKAGLHEAKARGWDVARLCAMRMSEAPRTGHIERIVFNDKWEMVRSERLLLDLHPRIRDIEQGPDGYLSTLTDEGLDGMPMRLAPGRQPRSSRGYACPAIAGPRRAAGRSGL